jgi:predicted helicase
LFSDFVPIPLFDFNNILEEYRPTSLSEKDKGTCFERLMQLYLMTEPYYASRFSKVWMWDGFPFRKDLGGLDTGIDLVAQTTHGAYWAIRAWIDTNGMDSFRKCLEEEFSAIYVFNLRGNQRTSGELSRKKVAKYSVRAAAHR